MASGLSDYGEDQIVNGLFRTTALSRPANWYFGLFTVAPTDTGGGTEVSGNSYARVAVAPSNANFAATSGGNGMSSNSGAITFPTASGSWGTVVAYGLFDAASGGNLWMYGDLTTAKAISSGDTPSFAASAFTFTIT